MGCLRDMLEVGIARDAIETLTGVGTGSAIRPFRPPDVSIRPPRRRTHGP